MERPTPKPAEEVKAVKARRQQKYKDNRQRVINHLKKRGLSNAAIAGIVGNIDIETGGSFDFQQRQTKSGKAHDPNFIKGGAYGLFQFDDPGKSAGHETWYKQYLEKTNKTDSTESQLDYVLDMVNAGEDTQDPFYNFSTNIGASNAGTIKGYFKISEDPKQVSDSITDRFLNPGVKHSDKRRASAQATFDELQPAEQADIDPDNQNINQAGDIVDTGEGVDPPEFEDERKAGLKDLPLIGRFFAEGGVPMKKQMEMFEDGGLMDEGGTVDPVSGNDVPPGSTQEEVRDDIPAQLSEGEFVFPADVVRYIGLGNLMSMRQEAKLGLQVMDKMGQMGNSEEATMPDNLPFDINDLDMADEREYNVGGFVPGTPQQQQYGIAGYQQAMTPTTGFMQQQPVQFGQQQPVQAASQQFVQPMYTAAPQQAAVPTMQQYKPEEIPTFTQTIGKDPGQYDELKLYRNDAGAELRIPFKNGQPIYPIPEGYKFVDPEATKTESVTPTTTTGQTGRVLSQDELRDRDDADAARRQEEIERFGNASHKIGLSNFYGEGRDQIFGVNLVEGYASGPQGYFQFMSGKHPEGALIMLKDGDQEYLVTGADYEKIKGDIGKSGARGNLSPSLSSDYDDTRTILDEGNYRAGQKAAKDFVDSLKKKDKGFLAGLVGGDEDDPSGLTSKQIDLMLKSFAGVTDYGVGGDDGADLTRPAFRIQDDDPGEDAGIRGTGRGEDSPSAARDFIASSARGRAESAAKNRAALERTRPSYADSGSPEDPPARRAAEQRARAADAAAARATAQAAQIRQQEDDQGPAMSTGTAQQDFSEPSPGTGSMEAARSSSTSRDFSAPAPSYSYGAGPRAKGGLIEKPKPKAKKKMKRGGLASKK